jgi:hypothetical protein
MQLVFKADIRALRVGDMTHYLRMLKLHYILIEPNEKHVLPTPHPSRHIHRGFYRATTGYRVLDHWVERNYIVAQKQ